MIYANSPDARANDRGTRQKLARKSARIAHSLPSHELASCARGTKYLQMRTIFPVEQRARQDSNL
jgi:hypothetical protein